LQSGSCPAFISRASARGGGLLGGAPKRTRHAKQIGGIVIKVVPSPTRPVEMPHGRPGFVGLA